MRDPFGNSTDNVFTPSPFLRIPNAGIYPTILRINSPLCRNVGLTTNTRLFGTS